LPNRGSKPAETSTPSDPLGSLSIDLVAVPSGLSRIPFAPRSRIMWSCIMRFSQLEVGRVGLEPTTDGL